MKSTTTKSNPSAENCQPVVGIRGGVSNDGRPNIENITISSSTFTTGSPCFAEVTGSVKGVFINNVTMTQVTSTALNQEAPQHKRGNVAILSNNNFSLNLSIHEFNIIKDPHFQLLFGITLIGTFVLKWLSKKFNY